jgi:hypothetical protein
VRVLLSTYDSRGGAEPATLLLESISRGKPPVPAELMP